MFRRKSTTARILTLGCAGILCLGGLFTWTGNGADDAWDTCGNWDACGAIFEFPGNEDDATVDGTHTIDLIDKSIDDLTLTGTITFGDANGDDPVLCLDTLTISAASDLMITEGARIITGPGCPF